MLNRLSSLVDRSLVVHSHEPEPYRMLETIRAYGRLRLDAEGQSEATRARHARHFRDRSRTLWPAAWTADEPIARRQILVQAADYRAAARWARDAGDLDLAAELVPAIADLTLDSAVWPGAGQLLEDLVAGTADPPPSWAPVVAAAALETVFNRGEVERGEALARRAIDLDPQFGLAHTAVGFARALQGDPAGALAAAEQGRRLTPRDRLPSWGKAALCCCWMLSMLGRDDEALRVADELLECGNTTGALGPLTWAYLARARISSATDPVAALEWFERAEPLVEASDNDGDRHQLHRDRASALLDVDLTAAALDLQWCLRNATEEPVAWGMLIAALHHVVVALARLGDPETAALVYGSRHSQVAQAPFEQQRLDRTASGLRDVLGDRFDELTQRGAVLTRAGPGRHRRRRARRADHDRRRLAVSARRGDRPSSARARSMMSAASRSSLVA